MCVCVCVCVCVCTCLHSLTLHTILNGDITLSVQRNIKIHTAVSKYIMKTNRFQTF